MSKAPSYDACNCFALRQASRYVTQIYERHLAPSGLSAAQFAILARLSRKPGSTMLALAEAMVMDRTTLVRALKPLQRDGLAAAEPSDEDARALVYTLTTKGARVFEKACVAWRAAQTEFEQHFGRERAKALRGELFDITQAMAHR